MKPARTYSEIKTEGQDRRYAVLRLYAEGLSFREIGARLGVKGATIGTFYMRTWRSLVHLDDSMLARRRPEQFSESDWLTVCHAAQERLRRAVPTLITQE